MLVISFSYPIMQWVEIERALLRYNHYITRKRSCMGAGHALKSMRRYPESVALDGPSASGKSTVGCLLAATLCYRFVDTGLMYRALTWRALQESIDLNDHSSLGLTADELDFKMHLDGERHWRMIVDDEDVTEFLHLDTVNRNVSPVSAIPAVRDALISRQRAMALDGAIVMAGRDIGTVVLPDADLKIFVTASVGVRAKRRRLEFMRKRERLTYLEVLEAIKRRDRIDSTRKHSPLRAAQDAITIDTDQLGTDEVVKSIMSICDNFVERSH